MPDRSHRSCLAMQYYDIKEGCQCAALFLRREDDAHGVLFFDRLECYSRRRRLEAFLGDDIERVAIRDGYHT